MATDLDTSTTDVPPLSAHPSTFTLSPPPVTSPPAETAPRRAGSGHSGRGSGLAIVTNTDGDDDDALNDSFQLDQDSFDLELNSMQEHVKNNLSETQERTARMMQVFKQHLGAWKQESEAHVRSLIAHQRSVEIRLAEAGEYLRLRAEEVRALGDEVAALKDALAAERTARVAADADNVRVRGELDADRASLATTLAANAAMKERYDASQRELGDAREELRVGAVNAQKAADALAASESLAARLRGEARNREAKCAALADQVERLERQLVQTRGAMSQDEFAAAQRHTQELEALRDEMRRDKESELAHARRQVEFMKAQMQAQKRSFDLANSTTATRAEREENALRVQLLERESKQLELQRTLDLERVHAAQVSRRMRTQAIHGFSDWPCDSIYTVCILMAILPAPARGSNRGAARSRSIAARNHARFGGRSAGAVGAQKG